MNSTDTRIPVTVLTGFLGSGKTTLLNRILTSNHGLKIAVIENEFGEIGIDNELVVNADEEIFEMNNGCICCTVRGDLIRILGGLMKRKGRFDYILVETTGLADPGPVAQTFFVDEEMKKSFRLDGIITLVDAKHVSQHLDESSECQEQIAFADRILLNKTDLVPEAELEALEQRIRSMNRMARIRRCQNADVPVAEVIGVHAFDLDAKLQVDADFLKEELPFEWSGEWHLPVGDHEIVCQPGPDPEMGVVVVPLPQAADVLREAAAKRAALLFSEDPVSVASGHSFAPGIGLVQLVFKPTGESRFGFQVGREGLYRFFTQHGPDEFAMQLRVGGVAQEPQAPVEHAPGHEHDDSVTSVGIEDPRPLDGRKLNEWLGRLVREQGQDIFRMKGILNVKGQPNRFIIQGVHMLVEGRADRPWKDDAERESQLVFIGRRLDRTQLEAGFRDCLA